MHCPPPSLRNMRIEARGYTGLTNKSYGPIIQSATGNWVLNKKVYKASNSSLQQHSNGCMTREFMSACGAPVQAGRGTHHDHLSISQQDRMRQSNLERDGPKSFV